MKRRIYVDTDNDYDDDFVRAESLNNENEQTFMREMKHEGEMIKKRNQRELKGSVAK